VLPSLKRRRQPPVGPADSEASASSSACRAPPGADTARLSTGIPHPGPARHPGSRLGGAFRDWPAPIWPSDGRRCPPAIPTGAWGRKITVDSATLMNKRPGVIEPNYLFGLDYDAIEIVIHPRAFIPLDGELADFLRARQSRLAHMIKLRLLYHASAGGSACPTPWAPRRIPHAVGPAQLQQAPDQSKYPCRPWTLRPGRSGGTMPAVMKAANERLRPCSSTSAFHFLDIPRPDRAVCGPPPGQGLGADIPTLERRAGRSMPGRACRA